MENLLRRDPAALQFVIERSVAQKARVVSEDEHESGLREILNYGHTFAHALESVTRYRKYLHGEAVGWGMIAAAKLAVAEGMFSARDAERVVRLTRSVGPLPAWPAVPPCAPGRTPCKPTRKRAPAACVSSCPNGSAKSAAASRFSRKIFCAYCANAPPRNSQCGAARAARNDAGIQRGLPGTRPEGVSDEREAAAHVREMFGRIAPRYDLLNHLLSLDIDKMWRRRVAKQFSAILRDPQARVLDLCCGTGDLAFAFRKQAPQGAQITGSDFVPEMLVRARAKASASGAERGIRRSRRAGAAVRRRKFRSGLLRVRFPQPGEL